MQRESYATARIEYAVPGEKVERALEHYLRKLSSKVHLHKAILFGSYAKDNYSHGSDVDIVIIADQLPKNYAERYAFFKDSVLGVDIEPFAFTREEWKRMVETGSGFVRGIVRHGRTVYPHRLQRKPMRKLSLVS